MKTFNFTNCRCCNDSSIKLWLDFGHTPIANLTTNSPSLNKYPLSVFYCERCGHLQLREVPDPSDVFCEYRYMSGVSQTFRKHFSDFATTIVSKYGLGNVLEIGSNDAFLLNEFKKLGCTVIGIEPSIYLQKFYEDYRISLIQDFFNDEIILNYKLENNYDIVCANNVMAHVPDSFSLMKNIFKVLKPDGILVAECGDQIGIINGKNTDNVYHEHIDYYSPYSFSKLAERANLYVHEVIPVNTHGISFRIICKKKPSNCAIKKISNDYNDSSKFVSNHLNDRRNKIIELLNGDNFIAYGAAAKSVTLLYCLNLVNYLEGVVDDNPLKQGMYFPGTSIKIQNSDSLNSDATVLITAWNLYDEIKNKLLARSHRGKILCI